MPVYFLYDSDVLLPTSCSKKVTSVPKVVKLQCLTECRRNDTTQTDSAYRNVCFIITTAQPQLQLVAIDANRWTPRCYTEPQRAVGVSTNCRCFLNASIVKILGGHNYIT